MALIENSSICLECRSPSVQKCLKCKGFFCGVHIEAKEHACLFSLSKEEQKDYKSFKKQLKPMKCKFNGCLAFKAKYCHICYVEFCASHNRRGHHDCQTLNLFKPQFQSPLESTISISTSVTTSSSEQTPLIKNDSQMGLSGNSNPKRRMLILLTLSIFIILLFIILFFYRRI